MPRSRKFWSLGQVSRGSNIQSLGAYYTCTQSDNRILCQILSSQVTALLIGRHTGGSHFLNLHRINAVLIKSIWLPCKVFPSGTRYLLPPLVGEPPCSGRPDCATKFFSAKPFLPKSPHPSLVNHPTLVQLSPHPSLVYHRTTCPSFIATLGTRSPHFIHHALSLTFLL